ncbi:MAG: DegV family EDD domain-containing protein [Lachnospiraceae bacterium]|nr:DegV family EDD domain-containing protein [Lachnospiraceae bacterium]
MKKIKNFLKFIIDAIKDPERELSERLFLMLTMSYSLLMLISLIFDMNVGNHNIITFIFLLYFIINPVFVCICFYKNKAELSIRIVGTLVVIAITPMAFFYNYGVGGGGAFWFVFSFLYVGSVFTGAWRNFLWLASAVAAIVCFYIDYAAQDLCGELSRKDFYLNSFIAMFLVGFVCFVMSVFQNRLFREESKRAKRETERAEELNRSQNQFFSSMSHEIRTPINSILGLNELILREEGASDEVMKDAQGIQGAGKMLLALINDILDFSKVKAGKMDIVPVEYSLGNMISEIVNMLYLRAKDKGLEFKVSIDPNVPSVLYGDEVRIKQILINLLNNSVKYTKAGSIGLHVESENTDDKTVSLRVNVSDTGMGIKKDAIPYLFDAFKRVDQGKNRYIEGTGLGLSIVKQLVDLMGGSVTVDSVYGAGTTFTVTVKQEIVDPTGVGELDIRNFASSGSQAYESSFTAPSARILIVDDNEMNLAVEKKLLADTKMKIDTVITGQEALNNTLNYKYDVILMDHLMPEMDGIECMHNIREQEGGLNRNVPVVVLTANAGSENRELYRKAGFDGYLVKPVSGASLEEVLIRHISRDKLNIRHQAVEMDNGIKTAAGYVRKVPVVISTSSTSDIPESLVRSLNIAVIPFLIKTDEGIFKDGSQLSANELSRYIKDGGKATPMTQDVENYMDFFAEELKKAHYLIHIAASSSMNNDYQKAKEASEAFDNVSVIDSGSMSSGTGILALIAGRLVKQDIPADGIIKELEEVKETIQCSFVLDRTDYLYRNGIISKRTHNLLSALQLHPSIRVNNNQSGISSIWFRKMKDAYRKYIRRAFSADTAPDTDIVFITYVDVAEETLLWFRDEVLKRVPFKKIVLQQATAAIASVYGQGAIGILYYSKGKKSYNLESFLINEEKSFKEKSEDFKKEIEETSDMSGSLMAEESPSDTEQKKLNWYETIKGIDGETAIKNSGSEDAFRTVLEIFYKAIDTKAEELKNFFNEEDWKNYTIKVHALKSSSRLIGAIELGSEAEALEFAGKDEKIDFIRENHERMIAHLLGYREALSEIFEDMSDEAAEEENSETEETNSEECTEEKSADENNGEEEFDEFIMESVFESVKEGADSGDSEMLRDIFSEMDDYPLPEIHRKKIDRMKACFENNDMEGMLSIMEEKENE